MPRAGRGAAAASDDPAERTRRSEAGRTHARAFRWDTVAEHLVEVYRGLVGT
jgi:hypothetical protein